MSDRRFALVDFTHMSRIGHLRLYEAGRTHMLPRAIAHAATKRELVAKRRPAECVCAVQRLYSVAMVQELVPQAGLAD